jgi:hypothetical protein
VGSTDLLNWVGDGSSAAGGGVYSSGTLTVQGSIIRNNQAIGGVGGAAYTSGPGAGGNAYGGGLYISSGTATISGTTLSANTAQGGAGGAGGQGDPYGNYSGANGGNGLGGALYVSSGTATLTSASVTQNGAYGGAGGSGGTGKYKGANGAPGLGEGGGIYVDAVSLVYLDQFTQTNVKHNHASTRDPDIAGSAVLL